MSTEFNSGLSLSVPVNEFGAPYDFNRRVKTFEESSTAAMETAINNWLIGLTVVRPVILPPVYLGDKANNMRVLVPYGYFTPPA